MVKQKETGKKTQEERREFTRNLLLESTIRQIAINGLHGCKLTDIVRSANVTTGAVQHLFGNRDALVLQSIEDIFRRTQLYSLPESGGIAERLHALVDYIIQMSGQHLYRALIDVIVNSRHDSELGKRIRKLLRRQNKRRAVWFAAYMADLNHTARLLF
jgi:AcrR family transcriptional regulator